MSSLAPGTEDVSLVALGEEDEQFNTYSIQTSSTSRQTSNQTNGELEVIPPALSACLYIDALLSKGVVRGREFSRARMDSVKRAGWKDRAKQGHQTLKKLAKLEILTSPPVNVILASKNLEPKTHPQPSAEGIYALGSFSGECEQP